MIQTLPLYSIVERWRDALASDQAITNYCTARYGRAPKIYVGANLKAPPTEADCPFIIIRPGAKEEGELEQFVYIVSVGWAIRNTTQTTDGNVIEQAGIQECDALGQLIYQVLADLSADCPVTRCEYQLEPIEFWPQFVGDMRLEISITPTIGGAITY